MNIFILGFDPISSAQQQCDAHVVKMILESGQMLSTAHRMLDGILLRKLSKSGKRLINYWDHPTLDNVLYKSVHENHPCTKWTRTSVENYRWHFEHFIALGNEFEHRFNKQHATILKLKSSLEQPPANIPRGPLTLFAQAMPDEFKSPSNPVFAYRRYYQSKQSKFKMRWTARAVPDWFNSES
jgi:hypothetical protein